MRPRMPFALAPFVFCAVTAGAAQAVELLVADTVNNDIRRFDADTGAFLGRLGESAGLLGSGEFAVGPDGNLYVAHFNFAQVVKLDGRTGQKIDSINLQGRPLYPRFGPDGFLYLNTTTATSSLLKFDPATLDLVDTITSVENYQGDFQFGPDGNVYVSNRDDTAITVYDVRTRRYVDRDPSTPELDPFAPVPGPGVPERIVFGPDGDLFALDSRRILRFDGETGDLLGEFVPAPPIGEPFPTSLAFGPDGNLYVGLYDGIAGNNTDGWIVRYDGDDGRFLGEFYRGPDLFRPGAIVFVPEPGGAAGGLVAAAMVLWRRRRG